MAHRQHLIFYSAGHIIFCCRQVNSEVKKHFVLHQLETSIWSLSHTVHTTRTATYFISCLILTKYSCSIILLRLWYGNNAGMGYLCNFWKGYSYKLACATAACRTWITWRNGTSHHFSFPQMRQNVLSLTLFVSYILVPVPVTCIDGLSARVIIFVKIQW